MLCFFYEVQNYENKNENGLYFTLCTFSWIKQTWTKTTFWIQTTTVIRYRHNQFLPLRFRYWKRFDWCQRVKHIFNEIAFSWIKSGEMSANKHTAPANVLLDSNSYIHVFIFNSLLNCTKYNLMSVCLKLHDKRAVYYIDNRDGFNWNPFDRISLAICSTAMRLCAIQISL